MEKFQPKHTKDDTFTPGPVYECVKQWILEKYPQFGNAEIVRPFWPGADYQNTEYPEGCLVLDNPPFSRMAEIVRFYTERGIHFFLFANHVTVLNSLRIAACHAVIVGTNINYSNGAVLSASFLTDLGPRITIAGDLALRLKEVQKLEKPQKKKYQRPPEIATSCSLGYLAIRGYTDEIEQAEFIRTDNGYHIFGGGVRLGESDAARILTAERSARGGDSFQG